MVQRVCTNFPIIFIFIFNLLNFQWQNDSEFILWDMWNVYNCLDKEEKLKNMPMIQAYKTFFTFWQWATQYFDSSSSEFLDKSAI